MSDALVTTEWLEQHLGDPGVRIIESSIDKSTYDAGHIPGAVWVDKHADVLRDGDESCGYVLTPRQYADLMSRLGVTPDMTVVWYGDRHSAHAMRGFWMMSFYRHPGPLLLLEGGRERWMNEGRPLSTESPSIQHTAHPEPARADETIRATWQDVRAAIDSLSAVVVDVRSPDEHAGKDVRAKRGGHVPGAVNLEWDSIMASPNEPRALDELRRLYERAGITPDKEVIAHCQLGVRASHTWFVLKHLLGYPNVKNYDGSWQEWGNREDLPIER